MEHTTPDEKIFNEIKEAAIKIWSQYDNTYGYADEKIERVNNLKNYTDNIMVAYRMFDGNNQSTLRQIVSEEANEYISNNN